MRGDPEVQRVVNAYQLGLPRSPVTGRTGELLGRGAGSSLEFQEYRNYLPGDDIRHLDWAAYARSDTLMVRLYREEISPRTEILLDCSRSMTSGGTAKPLVARQLAAAFALLSGRVGGRPALWLLDDSRPTQSLSPDHLDQLADIPFTAASTVAHLLAENAVSLRRQAVRIVISDFLFPHDPDALIRRLAADASTLWIVQVMNAWEASPTPLGGRKLLDLESAAEADLIIDRKAIASYQERLKRLQDELARACRRMHATWVSLIADRGLPALCREELSAAGILLPT